MPHETLVFGQCWFASMSLVCAAGCAADKEAASTDSGEAVVRPEDRGPSVEDCTRYTPEEWAYDVTFERATYSQLCRGQDVDPTLAAEYAREQNEGYCADEFYEGFLPCEAYQCVVDHVENVDWLLAQDNLRTACAGFNPNVDSCTVNEELEYWYCPPEH